SSPRLRSEQSQGTGRAGPLWAADRTSTAIKFVRRLMPTEWGNLDQVHSDAAGNQWIQLRTFLSSGVPIRIRALIKQHTVVVRGIERVGPSSLREGESVEVTYHHGRNGLMEAETVYVQPDDVTVSQGARG